jgi:hypothetical protein
MREVIGTSYLELICSKEALYDIIEEYIESLNTHFSFKDLCSHVKRVAIKRDYFKKESSTKYSSIELLDNDIKLINSVIWDKIINKELMIDFNKGEAGQFSNQFYFFKV